MISEHIKSILPEPLVTIGVPVYNGEKYLSQAIDSILAQDYLNIEIIIIDDCSQDESSNICQKYASLEPRITFLKSPTNAGMFANYRKILQIANGTYFTWVAQDDVIAPNCISTIIKYMEMNNDVVLCTSSVHIISTEDFDSSYDYNFIEISDPNNWVDSRAIFFSLPYTKLQFALYGIYQTNKIKNIPFGERVFFGKRFFADVENIFLANVCHYGKIVSLSPVLRSIAGI